MATIGDLVLVYQEETPAFFARIEDIAPDRKADWYQVKLLILQVPVVEAVWIICEAYIKGESFTMNGMTIRLEKVGGPHEGKPQSLISHNRASEKKGNQTNNKVISLFERKKR